MMLRMGKLVYAVVLVMEAPFWLIISALGGILTVVGWVGRAMTSLALTYAQIVIRLWTEILKTKETAGFTVKNSSTYVP